MAAAADYYLWAKYANRMTDEIQSTRLKFVRNRNESFIALKPSKLSSSSQRHSREREEGNSSRRNVENILWNSRKVFKPRKRKNSKPSFTPRGERAQARNIMGLRGKIFSINYHFFLGVWMNVRIIKLPFALPFFLSTKNVITMLLKTNQICKTTSTLLSLCLLHTIHALVLTLRM